MDRRRYLRVLGVAGTGALAGCTTLAGNPSTDATYEPDAEDHLAVAVGSLNTVALAVSTFEAADDPRAQGFDETLPRERLETARTALDDAEEAGETDAADIEAVRAYAAAVTGTVDALVDLLVASDTLEATEAQFEDPETDIEVAREAIDEARTASGRAAEARDVAVETSDRVDRDRLVALDAVIDELQEGLTALSGFVTGVDGLTEGYAIYLDGVADLQRAEAAFDDEAFGEAQDDFESARTAFDAAATTFADAREDAAASLVSDLDLGEARSHALGELSTGYVTLLDAQAELEAAEEAFENAEYETARNRFEAAAATAEDAETTFSRADDDPDLFVAEFEEGFDRARAVRLLSAGYADLSAGAIALEDGEGLLDDRAFDAAKAEFVAAGESFAAADEQFVTGQDAAGDELDTEFERARCRAGHLEAAAEHLQAAAEAGSNRNRSRLQSERESAEAELEAAEEC